jgi:thioesterase domain-containing protein
MHSESRFGMDYIQTRITNEFPLARHMGVVVERADDDGIVLSAPLAANANYKGTAFGGSLFSVAVLVGWAWVTRYLATTPFIADTVIQESTIRYLSPVHGTLRATSQPPSAESIEKFRKMLQRAGRGRIRLAVPIHHGQTLATEFEGDFAATIRDLEK